MARRAHLSSSCARLCLGRRAVGCKLLNPRGVEYTCGILRAEHKRDRIWRWAAHYPTHQALGVRRPRSARVRSTGWVLLCRSGWPTAMSRSARHSSPKSRASFWLELPVEQLLPASKQALIVVRASQMALAARTCAVRYASETLRTLDLRSMHYASNVRAVRTASGVARADES